MVEPRDDYKPAELMHQANDQRVKQYSFLAIGVLTSALGGLHFVIDDLRQTSGKLIKSATKLRADTIIGWLGVTLGLLSVGESFFFRHSARILEKRKRSIDQKEASFLVNIQENDLQNFTEKEHVSRLEKSRTIPSIITR